MKGKPTSEYNHTDSLSKLSEAIELVRLNLAKAFSKQSNYYDQRHSFSVPKVGDLVAKREHYLSSAIDKFSTKLANKYTGWFTVKKVVSANVYEVTRGEESHIVHIKDLKPFIERKNPLVILDSFENDFQHLDTTIFVFISNRQAKQFFFCFMCCIIFVFCFFALKYQSAQWEEIILQQWSRNGR